MPKIIKIADERQTQKQQQQKKKSRTRGTEAIAKGWEINDSIERLSSVFSNQYVKPLIFKSKLELAISIILNERIIWVKVYWGGV